jgi:hypothetical protein
MEKILTDKWPHQEVLRDAPSTTMDISPKSGERDQERLMKHIRR